MKKPSSTKPSKPKGTAIIKTKGTTLPKPVKLKPVSKFGVIFQPSSYKKISLKNLRPLSQPPLSGLRVFVCVPCTRTPCHGVNSVHSRVSVRARRVCIQTRACTRLCVSESVRSSALDRPCSVGPIRSGSFQNRIFLSFLLFCMLFIILSETYPAKFANGQCSSRLHFCSECKHCSSCFWWQVLLRWMNACPHHRAR